MWTALALIPPILIVSLHALSFAPSQHMAHLASFTARLMTSFAALIICALYGVIASLFLRAVGYGGLSQWTVARAFKWVMWVSTGVGFKVIQGEEYLSESWGLETAEEGDRRVGRRSRVIVGNHQTELDVLMLGHIFPKYCSVTAKKSLKWWPFLGWFMALSKTVFIDRANSKNARATFDAAAKTMQNERQTVYIFPEGTRSYAEKPVLLPFKKGAFHLAVQAQVPVVPVVVANYSRVLNVKRKIFNAGTIPIVVLEPIPTAGMTTADVDELTNRVREAMLAELEKLSLSQSHSNGVSKHEPMLANASGVDTGAKVRNAL